MQSRIHYNLNFFMEVKRAQDSNIEMDRVIHELIILCKQIDIHIVMVQHPKKTDDGRVESEFDIKGSSAAVQEAHNVFLLNRPKSKDIADGIRETTDRELKIAKLRRRGKYVGKSILFSIMGGKYYEQRIKEERPKIQRDFKPSQESYRRNPYSD